MINSASCPRFIDPIVIDFFLKWLLGEVEYDYKYVIVLFWFYFSFLVVIDAKKCVILVNVPLIVTKR